MAGFHTIMMGDHLGFAKDKKYMLAGSGNFYTDSKAGAYYTYYRGYGFPNTGASLNSLSNYRIFSSSNSTNFIQIASAKSTEGGSASGPWVQLFWTISSNSLISNSGWTNMRIRNLDGAAVDVTRTRADADYNSSSFEGTYTTEWIWNTGTIPTLVSGTTYMIEWT